jgi:hypothetical protein
MSSCLNPKRSISSIKQTTNVGKQKRNIKSKYLPIDEEGKQSGICLN